MKHLTQDYIPSAVIDAPELDGCGPLILSIVTKYARKMAINTEDLYQDAIIYYLRHKHKWDESRGARTTYIHQLMRSFCNFKAKQAIRASCNQGGRNFNKLVVSSKASPWLDADAKTVAEAGLLGSVYSVTGVAKSLCWDYKRAEAAVEEIRQAYSKRSASKVWGIDTRREPA